VAVGSARVGRWLGLSHGRRRAAARSARWFAAGAKHRRKPLNGTQWIAGRANRRLEVRRQADSSSSDDDRIVARAIRRPTGLRSRRQRASPDVWHVRRTTKSAFRNAGRSNGRLTCPSFVDWHAQRSDQRRSGRDSGLRGRSFVGRNAGRSTAAGGALRERPGKRLDGRRRDHRRHVTVKRGDFLHEAG